MGMEQMGVGIRSKVKGYWIVDNAQIKSEMELHNNCIIPGQDK